jgi:glutamyl-tRNA synthetase
MDELIAAFDVENVNPNPARFDQKKADAINAAHIRLLSPADFKSRVIPYLQSAGVLGASVSQAEHAVLDAACPLIQERITVLSEASGMLGFLFNDDIVVQDDAKAGLPSNAKEILDAAVAALEGLDNWETSAIQDLLSKTLIETMGLKPRDAFGPLRTGISGRRISPPLFESMEILGKERSLARLRVFASSL